MDLPPTLPAVAASSIACTLLVPVVRKLAVATGSIALPSKDRFHAAPVPMLGGVAVLVAIAAGMAAAGLLGNAHVPWSLGPRYPTALLAGAAGFFLLGWIDDRRPLPAAAKGASQLAVLAVALLLWGPQGRLAGPWGFAAAAAAGLILVNAWNYLDHADGVFAVSGVVSAGFLASIWGGLSRGGPESTLAACIAGALAGYLVWNRPPAKIFLGDCGSLAIGFLFAAIALGLADGASADALPAAFAAQGVAIADMLLVTSARLIAGEDPFRGGTNHSGHRLAAAIGLGPTLGALAAVAALVGTAGVALGSISPPAAFGILTLLVLALAFVLGRFPPPVSRAKSTSTQP